GTALDNVGITQVTWSTDHGASGIAIGTTSWTINGLVLPIGSTRVTVATADGAGNLASAILTVTYTVPDTTPPTVNITLPTSNPTFATSNSTINLGGTALD